MHERLEICHIHWQGEWGGRARGGVGRYTNSHNWHLSQKTCCWLWEGRMLSDHSLQPGKPALPLTCLFLCLRIMLEPDHLFTGDSAQHPSQLLPKAAFPEADPVNIPPGPQPGLKDLMCTPTVPSQDANSALPPP